MKNANPVSFLAAALGLLLVGCTDKGAVAAAPSVAPPGAKEGAKTVADWFPLRVGNREVRMQVAVRPPEMERGLMGRRDLGRDDGMIFVYEKPMRVVFWMKDTPTPLDIAYFTADGALAEVWPAFPFDEKNLPSHSDRIQFVLEMKQGWYGENGVKPGDKMDLGQISAALKARGFNPEGYGLK